MQNEKDLLLQIEKLFLSANTLAHVDEWHFANDHRELLFGPRKFKLRHYSDKRSIDSILKSKELIATPVHEWVSQSEDVVTGLKLAESVALNIDTTIADELKRLIGEIETGLDKCEGLRAVCFTEGGRPEGKGPYYVEVEMHELRFLQPIIYGNRNGVVLRDLIQCMSYIRQDIGDDDVFFGLSRMSALVFASLWMGVGYKDEKEWRAFTFQERYPIIVSGHGKDP